MQRMYPVYWTIAMKCPTGSGRRCAMRTQGPSARPTIYRRPERLAIKPDEQGLWRLLQNHLQKAAVDTNLRLDVINTSYALP
jgi:hypothetical protein